jgi:hypothetical protein
MPILTPKILKTSTLEVPEKPVMGKKKVGIGNRWHTPLI